uniref:C2 domain-containing protein n=1 Tax=Mola mola TaxID=94237 RepID=A0A3Q3W307_MOLML
MEVKKKNFLENLRLKTKLGNLKKPRKKALKEQGRNLAHRRSISVPNLNLLPGGAFPESTFETSEAIYFGISPGLSDSDSIASSSNNDGPLFSDKLQDSISESGLKVPTYLTDAALSRYSAPEGSLMLGEEMKDELINSGSENKMIKEGFNYCMCIFILGTSDPYVKFKLEGKQLYKSKVVYKSLNPRWNESFSHPLRDKEHIIELRVYDKNRTADEFMGSCTICLKNLELYKTYEMELHLNDAKSKQDDMGVILVDVCLMFRDATVKRGPVRSFPIHEIFANSIPCSKCSLFRPVDLQKSPSKNQMWKGVLGITLVEGQDLPQYGQGDIFVRYRLGDQQYKSKEPLQVEVYSKRGRKGEESWGMFEIDLSRLPINETQLYNHVLDPGKGRLVFLVTLRPCWGVSISDIETATLEKPDERDAVKDIFSLKNSHKCMEEIGFLQVKVIKANDLPAVDLNRKSNPLCVVELGNSRLHTHTVYKTLNPEWSKAFTIPIKDIHDVIQLTILDENGDKAPNFLGKVAIPLLTVQNGQQICLLLKKEDLGSASKGTITLVLEVIYNKVRIKAGIRTFKPKETKLMEENIKFSKKVLAQNIYRVRKISTAVLYTLQYINSCFQWESTQRSLIAFLIFLVTVWHWELFMLPLFLLLLIGWHYFHLSAGKTSSNQDLVSDQCREPFRLYVEAGKKGLMDKIHMVQEVVLVVQTVLEEIANIGERIKNVFNWTVPFLSCLACLVLFVATVLLYCFPLRYIVLIWGASFLSPKLPNCIKISAYAEVTKHNPYLVFLTGNP